MIALTFQNEYDFLGQRYNKEHFSKLSPSKDALTSKKVFLAS